MRLFTLVKINMELIFVTGNIYKMQEIRHLLGEGFQLGSLQDLGFDDEIPEIHPTLEQNASAKAFYIYERFSVDCFADDTGLEVETLNNKPGVWSARFAEIDPETKFRNKEELTEANIIKLLDMLKGKDNRKARFRTVISLILNGRETLFEGVAEGRITGEKRGGKGFGYDPVFIPEGYDKTFAEMSLEEKNKISHRARALEKLVGFLKSLKGRE